MKIIDEKAFDAEVLKSETPVVVDFYADWCGPCRQLGMVLEKVVPEYEAKMKFVKVNIDNASKVASDYGIQSIPTLMVFKDGKILKKQIGGIPAARLQEFLNDIG